METRKKRAARLHSQSEAPQAPTGNQEEDQGKASSPQCASNPGRSFFHMASLPGAQLASPSVDLPTVTDRPTADDAVTAVR